MEVYILDNLLRRVDVQDRFESLIWTERFSQYGDFELILHSNSDTRARFVTGVRLAVNNSHRVMVIETAENKTDSDGKTYLTVKGRSLESILEDRVAFAAITSTGATPKWVLNGKPGDVVRSMFDQICRQGLLNVSDVIPFLTAGTIYPADNIQEVPYEIKHEQEPATLYDAIKNLCELYDLGFRLYRNYDTSQLYFNVYTGSDRTSGQKLLPAVVFAPELDNLQNTTSLKTIDQVKNCAYVFSEDAAVVVYPDDVAPDVAGFERHVLFLEVTDVKIVPPEEVDPNNPPPADHVPQPEVTYDDVVSALYQRGREELQKHRTFAAFDGEIDENSLYKYGVHYNLGDLVEIRSSDGEANMMRVTEQIFVSDGQGERSYPTLTQNVYINPGSWLTWDYNQIWQDMGPEEFWSNA